MNLWSTIRCFTSGTQSDGSSLTHPPHLITDTPAVRDIVRKRLVHHQLVLLPDDVSGNNADQQSDNSSFVGKPYRTQDTKYGHLINEYDSSEAAHRSALARPYTRVLHHPEPGKSQLDRDAKRKQVVEHNPDTE